VSINGKVSSILELGTGFHPDYTGRDNIYMGGLCLGMSPEEVKRKIDSIIEFSELGDYIDRPFKTYSTGMQGRLTFAVAASVDPDILIVDEALATGDLLFQEKCYKRIRQITTSGATVLIVSHSMPTIFDLCSRAFLLHKGEMLLDDLPRRVGYAYEKLLMQEAGKAPRMSYGPDPSSEKTPDSHEPEPAREKTPASHELDPASEGFRARITGIQVLNQEGDRVGTMWYGQEYVFRISCECFDDLPSLLIGFRIQRPNGEGIYAINTIMQDTPIVGRKGEIIELDVHYRCNLNAGVFLLGSGVGIREGTQMPQLLHFLVEGLQINVESQGPFSGLVDLGARVGAVRYAGQRRMTAA
jgi:ABC-type multidrug transport system ATPase subunit